MKDLERPRVYGVYVHKSNGKIAIAEGYGDTGLLFKIDKNEKKRGLFGMHNVFETGSGNYFFNKSLSNYEYLGEF